MRIIISPAKTMNVDTDTLPVLGMPEFLPQTEEIMTTMQSFSYEEAKELWKCNDKLAALNFERFSDMDLTRSLTPAILSYEGLVFQHLAPSVLTEQALEYLKNHLRILSGFYGALAPFDGVVPYRLEMQARLSVNGSKNLYDYWGSRLYDAVIDADHTIINLASKEYSQIIQKYCAKTDRFITIDFGELVDGKVKQKGTFAKMARGEMVRYLAENQITDIENIKNFTVGGYRFLAEKSDSSRFVFVSN